MNSSQNDPSDCFAFEINRNMEITGVLEEVFVYTVNEENLHKSPHVKLSIGGQDVLGLKDKGAEGTTMSEQLFNTFKNRGVNILSIPTTNYVLTAAFGCKSKRIETSVN
jgi:hypothetical protein